MSIITTFESQCRALTSVASPDENASRFLVGTLSPNGPNLLYLFEHKDDNNNLAKVSLKFPFGESWHLSTSSKYPKLVAGVLGSGKKLSVCLFMLPDELENSLDDDYILSESPIEKKYEPIPEGKNLVRQSHWHPDDGHQLLTCNDGNMEFWDINQQKQARNFSISIAAEKSLDLEPGTIKSVHITDLRWSSLFNSSVVAAAIGSKIYGIDTRIPDTSPTSVCWLIEDNRCNRVRSIDFNPNSQYYIASGGDDCRANFWDLRQTARPALQLKPHSHWIWSVRYNPFHDQLVLSAGSDARIALMRAHSTASEPYDRLADDNEDGTDGEDDDSQANDNNAEDKNSDVQNESQASETQLGDDACSRSSKTPKIENGTARKADDKYAADEVIKLFEEHDDSIYAVEWATDPWIFASLGFESRFVINKVPKAEKFNILF